MEQGFDRARAATFAWTSTAFPMLTGTLVTAAGFLPVGFANSSTGEYAGGIFWVVGARADRVVVRGGAVHALSRRQAAAGFRQARGGAPASRSRTRSTTPASTAALRHVIEFCLRWRKSVVAATVLHVRGARSRASASCSSSSSRPRRAPSCSSRCGCRKAPRSASPTRRRRKAESLLTGDPDIVTYTSYVGPGRAALLARAQSGAAEHQLRADRHRHQGPRGARARQGAARTGARRRRAAGGAHPCRPLQRSGRRSASRCSSASSGPIR